MPCNMTFSSDVQLLRDKHMWGENPDRWAFSFLKKKIYFILAYAQMLRCVQLFVTPWTIAHQSSLSMGFSRQEHWSGLPLPPPGEFPYPRIAPGSPAWQADSLPTEASESPILHCTVDLQCCVGFWSTAE